MAARPFRQSDCRSAGRALAAALFAFVLLWPHSWAGRGLQAEQAAEKDGKDAASDADSGDAERRVGHLMKVKLPITGDTYATVRRFVRKALDKAKAESYRPVLIFQFEVRDEESRFGRGSEFGACSDLARFLTSREVTAAQTVAYVPSSIQGHAVLAVLACDEIIMAADAEIGSAGIDEETIEPYMRSTYKVIAERRKNFPSEIALAFLDPALEVLEVKTELGTEYVTPEGLARLREEEKTIIGEPEALIAAGQPAVFSGSEARKLRFVGYLASEPREVARALGLPPEAVEEDLALSESWVAIGVPLKGVIDHERIRQTQTMIEDAILDRGVNLVVVWIDSAGGSPTDSIQLANYLANDLKTARVHTVAYVAETARGDAALIALACDQLVIEPEAILGGPGNHDFSKEEIKDIVDTIARPESAWRHRSWSLVAAMVDPNLEVFRYTRDGDVEFFCSRELEEVEAARGEGQWVKGELVTRPGVPLRVRGDQAKEYRLADLVVESFAQFQAEFGLKDDLALVEPGWADFLIDALASPAAAGLLLAIGFFALYFELHTPGLGIGGFAATVCFLIFFWSRFLGGTAGWLEAILFIAGIGCLLLEVFVLPGFGVFGLGGGILVLASLVLASQTFVLPRNTYQFEQFQQSLLILLGASAGVIGMAYVARKWLPRAPMFNRMFLEPPEGEEAATIRQRESLVDYSNLVGDRGVTTTQLTPGGKARFGNRLVDVMADGELIERGTPIVVVEVYGSRVLVRSVEES